MFIKLVAAALAVALPIPALAVDFNAPARNPVLAAVEATGTKIHTDHADCSNPNIDGFYQFYRRADGTKIDLMVLCAVNIGSKAELDETIRHEAMHVVQACQGGTIFNHASLNKYRYSALNRNLESYPSDKRSYELEAFVVSQFESDQYVADLVYKYCFE
jgi:hypothetical protein